ncbi:MAG: hypothetical protein M3416_17445 [Acidobacteriota bacterium]|nr:hypothetical protein [Acidobacteriota bacterium]
MTEELKDDRTGGHKVLDCQGGLADRAPQLLQLYHQLHLLDEYRKEKDARRRRENREQIFNLAKNGVVTSVCIVVLGYAVFSACNLLLDPQAPPKTQEIAKDFLLAVAGAVTGYLFGKSAGARE